MPEFRGPYVYATTHEFKSNISQWTRMLECGAYKGLFVTRRGIPVGVYLTDGVRELEEAIRKKNGPRVKNLVNQDDG